ncbi:unnamed protein product [Dibothriocephalus latus]|uniref:Uncharacterized protein n=1 Tax=Dibothriocephalus latus TaxID=60516 RepID=A0A3P6PAJ9_DIBLA|nr:unnamed protein product [Dibothriocephalus latus]
MRERLSQRLQFKNTFSVFGIFIRKLFAGAFFYLPVSPIFSISTSLWPADSSTSHYFGKTYDLNENFGAGDINMQDAVPSPTTLNEEASTDVDIGLVSSLDSDADLPMNSIDASAQVTAGEELERTNGTDVISIGLSDLMCIANSSMVARRKFEVEGSCRKS